MTPHPGREQQLTSIVIPTLNEALALGKTLDVVAKLRGSFEVIVVDGDSDDATVAIARAHGVRVLRNQRGRGIQLHAGACAARGDVLWFLHADTHPAVDAIDHIRETLREPAVVGGHFDVWFDGRRRAARFLTRLYPHLGRFGLCYGDSALFVRRRDYSAIGGFRPFPLFEDLDLVRRLKERGRFVRVPSTVVASSRRFEGRSFLVTFAAWVALQLMFSVGVHPRTLGRLYGPIRGRVGPR
jgi:rSAM/selenodomain-associated transferase 2